MALKSMQDTRHFHSFTNCIWDNMTVEEGAMLSLQGFPVISQVRPNTTALFIPN